MSLIDFDLFCEYSVTISSLMGNIFVVGRANRIPLPKKKEIVRRRRKPNQLKIENYYLQYRSTLVSTSNLIRDVRLKERHIKLLKKIPFWNFFKLFIDKKITYVKSHDKVSLMLIETYSRGSMMFKIGKKLLIIEDLDIALIFGIKSGSLKMNITYSRKPQTPFMERWFGEGSRPTLKSIKNAALDASNGTTKDDVEDVVRLLCLYVILSILFLTSGNTAKWVFIQYIENIEEMKMYAWCAAIKDYLMAAIEKSSKDARKVNGCVLALQVVDTRFLPTYK